MIDNNKETETNEEKKELPKTTKHDPDYDSMVPNAIFDIEDSDEIAEMWLDMFGCQFVALAYYVAII